MVGLREIQLVRHGESVANVAAALAESAGAEVIDAGYRDADVPLSPRGREQAAALARRLAGQPAADSVHVSPYLRARETAALALGDGTSSALVDERLRDRELGVLDLLTSAGVEARLPDEARRRRWLGKYYYRPPGGESWADVTLRLRSFLRDLDAATSGTALLVTHDAVVTLTVGLLCGWQERELLDFARAHAVANASVTTLRRDEHGWALVEFADVAHVETSDAEVTVHAGDKDPEVH